MADTRRDDTGLLPWDLHHNDLMYWKKDTTLYFDERGKRVRADQFVLRQKFLDAFENRIQTGHE